MSGFVTKSPLGTLMMYIKNTHGERRDWKAIKIVVINKSWAEKCCLD